MIFFASCYSLKLTVLSGFAGFTSLRIHSFVRKNRSETWEALIRKTDRGIVESFHLFISLIIHVYIQAFFPPSIHRASFTGPLQSLRKQNYKSINREYKHDKQWFCVRM